jgi:hypothetical protein
MIWNFWFDQSLRLCIELYFLPYRIIGAQSH